MSFFNKLKSRLTRSSSKLEKGLEDIVAENAAEPEASEAPEPEAEPKPQARPEPEPPEPVSLPDPTFPAPGYVPAPVTEPVEQENAQPAKAPLDIQPALPKADPVPRKPGLLGRMFGAEPKVDSASASGNRYLNKPYSRSNLKVSTPLPLPSNLRTSSNKRAGGIWSNKCAISLIGAAVSASIEKLSLAAKRIARSMRTGSS